MPDKTPKTYLFVLGREPLLSAAEIAAVLNFYKITFTPIRSDEGNYIIEATSEIDTPGLIRRLGGTIKIGEKLDIAGDMKKGLADYLSVVFPTGKINFSLSGGSDNKTALQIKKILKELGRSVRYVEPKNTATIIHNGLVDKGADTTVWNGKIFRTVAVQPIEELGERDFGRPGRDDVSGMLPPKLAMMMINLAEAPLESVILDPFCGSGTILTEAMLMGYRTLYGTDSSEQAVADSEKNIEWLNANFKIQIANFQTNPNIQISKLDVVKLSEKFTKNSVDCIVTEPYLGRPLRGSETRDELLGQAEELKKLYLTAFEQFGRVMKKNGVVIFVIPKFKFREEWIKIDCLAEIKKLGFEPVPLLPNFTSLSYSRPTQRVAREIWRFRHI